MSRANPYQPGGALQGDSYIMREADKKLQRAILDNTLFPYFLAARQSGKSSILAQTQAVLRSPDLQIAIVDLSEFAPVSLSSYERFVSAFITEILSEIGSEGELRDRIAQAEKSPRFLLESIRAIVSHVAGRLVICIDEIDVLTRCDFKDAFLGQIRALFNRRTREGALKRIQFVLAGAASSEDLITDLRQSPFNVGEDIRLDDLSSDGVKQLLLLGWQADTPQVDEANHALLSWTSGSVFLCQDILHRAFQSFYDQSDSSPLPQLIEKAVADVINESAETIHFRNIGRILNDDAPLLNKWRDWTMGRAPNKGIINDLLIAGICRRDAPFRNRIYEFVFGHRGPLSLLASEPPIFAYDVFVSHSPTDKAVVRAIAERLRQDGLRVWFDEWELKSGDNIPAKIEDGLERSRTVVFCMSANAFGSDWAQLEAYTFRFRDPLAKERRFIPLRLDETPIKGSIAQFLYINWVPGWREREYGRLLEACQPPGHPMMAEEPVSRARYEEKLIQLDNKSPLYIYVFSPDGKRALSGGEDRTVRLWDVDAGHSLRVLEGHAARVRTVAWSSDQRWGLSGSEDRTVRLWDVETGRCLRIFKGHTQFVNSVVWSADQRHALSSSADSTVRLWDIETGRCLRVLEGHTKGVLSVAWSTDQRHALSGSWDGRVRLWNVETGRCLRVLEGHTHAIWQVAWSLDQRRALSGSEDKTVRLWDVETGRCLRVLEGHTGGVWSVIWNTDCRLALSGSRDNTVRLWDVETGRCLCVLEGHTSPIMSLAWSADQRHAFSGDENGGIRVWDLSEFVRETRTLEVTAPTLPEQVQYTNAKVLLVGESGAGKTGLSKVLAGEKWQPSDSTVGAWATQWKLPVSSESGVEREIWLWDFGGQADQRLIHQLYMDETALAVLVFDGQREDLFETLGQWDRDLTRASRNPFTKLLVAGRVDAGGLRVSRNQIETFAKERGFKRFLETSAKIGIGREELKQAILDGIRWEDIPWRSSPLLFKRLKEEIVCLKDEGRVLMRFNELRETLRLRLSGEGARFTDEELKAVMSLLAGPGLVWELKFGSWVLLQPELINAYAQAVIQTMREDKEERGCLAEDRVLNGDLTYYSSLARLGADEERFILLAMHQTLVERGLCLREYTDKGTLLVFPSYYRRERPELEGHPAVLVSYRFSGFLDDIYATLVVRLQHTKSFEHDELWRYAADFKTPTRKQLGLKLTRLAEGAGELEVYFDPSIVVGEKIVFAKYVHEHLLQNARDVVRLRHYVCPHCFTPVGNREVAMRKLEEGKKDILCVECEKRVPLWDQLEELFASAEMKERVRKLQERSAVVLDNESKERALVGEVISTVALAGQLSREFSISDYGLNMEIEFKSDAGEATGKKLYLHLESGDSSLRKSKGDGVEIFEIKDEGHARYWMEREFPVLLVIRNLEGEVRWMEVRDWLKRASDNGKKSVKQIVFEGERLDVMSVRRWRDKALSQA
jgi:small GTP-binding protein